MEKRDLIMMLIAFAFGFILLTALCTPRRASAPEGRVMLGALTKLDDGRLAGLSTDGRIVVLRACPDGSFSVESVCYIAERDKKLSVEREDFGQMIEAQKDLFARSAAAEQLDAAAQVGEQLWRSGQRDWLLQKMRKGTENEKFAAALALARHGERETASVLASALDSPRGAAARDALRRLTGLPLNGTPEADRKAIADWLERNGNHK